MSLPSEWTPDCYVRNVVTDDGVVRGEVRASFYEDGPPIICATVWDRRGMVEGETFSNSLCKRQHCVVHSAQSIEAAMAACDAKLSEVVLMAPPDTDEQLEANRPLPVGGAS